MEPSVLFCGGWWGGLCGRPAGCQASQALLPAGLLIVAITFIRSDLRLQWSVVVVGAGGGGGRVLAREGLRGRALVVGSSGNGMAKERRRCYSGEQNF